MHLLLVLPYTEDTSTNEIGHFEPSDKHPLDNVSSYFYLIRSTRGLIAVLMDFCDDVRHQAAPYSHSWPKAASAKTTAFLMPKGTKMFWANCLVKRLP